jgi:competence ComEA-like helix-hairpin-helix protein
VGRLRESAWAKVLLKAVGVTTGMMALAAIGASSMAHGAFGAATAPSAGAPTRVAAGLSPLGGARTSPGQPAAPPASATEARDAGAPRDASADGTPPPATGLTPDGKVILNRAGLDELRLLPGIGVKRAQGILELRQKLGGRFRRMSDLLRLKGIGPKSLRKIEAKAVLD